MKLEARLRAFAAFVGEKQIDAASLVKNLVIDHLTYVAMQATGTSISRPLHPV